MKIINELVTPFNDDKKIDIICFKKLIEESQKNNDFQLLFSTYGDGMFLSFEEKKLLLESLNNNEVSRIIYYLQLEQEIVDNKIIDFLNDIDIEYIMINPPLSINCSQNGLFLYMKKILKRIKNKKIILHNSSLSNAVNFHFQTIKKLIKLFPSVIGIYENGIDFSLISLLKTHFSNLNIYVSENLIEYALEQSLDGIISISSLIFNDDIKTIIEDYQNDFKNSLLINYLLFVYEILSFSNNSVLLKTYLKRLGYQSMEVRLPLIIEQSDIENLDFLLS